jgi:hypothetical protein
MLIPLSTTNNYYFQGNICLQEGLKEKKKKTEVEYIAWSLSDMT